MLAESSVCLQQPGSLAALSSCVRKTVLLDCLEGLMASKTEVHNSQLPIMVPWPRALRDMGMCCVCYSSGGRATTVWGHSAGFQGTLRVSACSRCLAGLKPGTRGY